MSLVGNLEELGLGETLQIVTMSRRSGVLSLKSRGREARIIFRNGQVVRASSSSFQQSLGEVLIQKGVIDLATLKRALSIQAGEGYRQLLGTIMVERFEVNAEVIEEVVREQIENVVYSLFAWAEGSFEFELQEVAEGDAAKMDPIQFMLKQGLNPQYLAMEGLRILDEKRHRGEADEEPEAVAAPERAPDSACALAPPKAAARPEPAPAPFKEEIADPFWLFEPAPAPTPAQSVEVTAWLVMALGGALLAYGITGLMNYYSRDWQAALSQPLLVPVSKLSIFFQLGFIPWTVTLSSLYLVWAADRFRKLRKDSLSRLIEGAWSGVALAVLYEAVEFGNWVRISFKPTFSYYVAGAADSLLWALLLSAPFAGLLFYLKSAGFSREFRKASQLQSINGSPSRN